MVVHDLCKPLDDCLPKSVSTPGSHKSPFRLSAPAMDLHQNMLPKDLAYYKPIKTPKNKDYLVGKYSNLLSSDNTSNIMSDLYFSEFNVLSGKNWLSNFIIDICLLSYAKNLRLENTHILSCNDVTCLLGKREVGEVHNKITFNENSMVILPWLFGVHWIVVFINFNTRNRYIMDPMRPYDIEHRTPKDRFNRVFKMLKSDVIYGDGTHQCPLLTQISCPFENVPKQNYEFNCGVYIIYYAFKFMDNSKFSLEFDPNTYREYLKAYLLENSEDMTNICLYCSWNSDKHRCQPVDEYVEWVTCSRLDYLLYKII